jgi:hypothetical protein
MIKFKSRGRNMPPTGAKYAPVTDFGRSGSISGYRKNTVTGAKYVPVSRPHGGKICPIYIVYHCLPPYSGSAECGMGRSRVVSHRKDMKLENRKHQKNRRFCRSP